MMAARGRSATGLSWPRFVRAQVPGALLAVLFGGAVAVTVHATLAAHLGGTAVLIAGGLTAAVVAFALWRLRSEIFLGPHGIWASRYVAELLRDLSSRGGRVRFPSADALAKVNPE